MPVEFIVNVPRDELKAPKIGHGGGQGLNPRTDVLSKGSCTGPGRRLMSCEVLGEYDVAEAHDAVEARDSGWDFKRAGEVRGF